MGFGGRYDRLGITNRPGFPRGMLEPLDCKYAAAVYIEGRVEGIEALSPTLLGSP